MADYISSNANRFYATVESIYGQAAPVTATNRFPALRVQAHQVAEPSRRRDKTGARSYAGASSTARRRTVFEVQTYFTSWSGTGEPAHGPFFHAGLGGQPSLSSGLSVSAVLAPTQMRTATQHGLSIGSGISYGGEIRFVTAVPDSATLIYNAPFSTLMTGNAILSPVITYRLATSLPSITVYDYWPTSGAVSRIITGGAVDRLEISIEGDRHSLQFSGPAGDLLDSSSFAAAAHTAGLSSFSLEPELSDFEYSIVPGHLGQVWLGSTPSQFFTLSSGSINVRNSVAVRDREFGSSYPQAIVPGRREVEADFTLFAQDDTETAALYAAAKLRMPTSAMLQLGQGSGQLMGIYLPLIVPEIPAYDDAEARLQWQFKNCLAQGQSDDEIYIAFA